MIFEILTTVSFLAGLQFILTIILPAFVALFGLVYIVERVVLLINQARQVAYQAGIDYLEWTARLDNLRDDHARRELAIAEAGLALWARRLELQGKRLELLGTIGEID